MTDAPPPVPFDTLLRHREFLRSLARRLVADPNLADDVEQETWLVAMRSPPRDATSPRGWLATVARNAARKLGRSATRRLRYETSVAPRNSQRRADELVAEAEVGKRLIELVLALDEPYRGTVLLRYFDGLEPPEIAARTGVPVETVRTRLKRAAAQLRELMDERHGGNRRAWAVVLVGRPRPVAVGVGGGLAMGMAKKVAVAAVLLLLVGGSAAWLAATARTPAPSPADTAAAGAIAAPVFAQRAVRQRSDAGRSPNAPRAEVPPAEDAAVLAEAKALLDEIASKQVPLEGRVTDGKDPVAGAEVRLRFCDPAAPPPRFENDWSQGSPRPAIGPSVATTDALGVFRTVAAKGARYDVEIAAPGFEWWHGTVTSPATPLDVKLVRLGSITGRVRLADGSPVADVAIWVEEQQTYRGRTKTGADGRFRLDDVPSGGLIVHVVHSFDGTGPNVRQFQVREWKHKGDDLDLVVEAGVTIGGRIVCADGSPPPRCATIRAYAEGKTYAADAATLRADGSFAVFGLAPGRYRVAAEILAQPGEPHRRCEPIEGVEAGTTNLVFSATGGLTIDGVTDLPPGASDVLVVFAAQPDPSDAEAGRGVMRTLEPTGAFRVAGLSPGKYRIVFRDRQMLESPLQAGESAVVEAGSADVRLAISSASTVSGRVTFNGRPLGRGTVVLREAGGERDVRVATTWPDGRFVFIGLGEGKRWDVVAFWKDLAPGRARNVPTGSAELDVALSAGLRLAGRVLRDDGAPAPKIVFWLRDADGRYPNAARSGADGAFDLLGVEPGEYTAVLLDEIPQPGKKPKETEIGRVRAGDTNVELRLQR